MTKQTKDTEPSSPLDQHMKKIARGGAFFRTLYQLCQLAIAGTVIAGISNVVMDYEPPPAEAAELVGFSAFPMWVALIIVVCLKALPFLLLALGFRHLENLFKAVHGSIEELRTTV